jgi:hypothetical protein
MTPPVNEPADPTAVILARLEVKLDNALTEQARHTATIDRHDGRLNELATDIASLKTTVATLPKKAVSPTALMWAVGTAVGAIGVLITLVSTLITKGAS